MSVVKSILYLKRRDKRLSKLIDQVGYLNFPGNGGDAFLALVKNIIYQQLSGAVAGKIFKRFLRLVDEVTPENVSKLSNPNLKGVGLSERKVSYLKDLAQHFIDGRINQEKFNEMSDEEIVTSLMNVHGIGPWTAEMFLMFNLGRKDVFSTKDLGLHKAICKLYDKKYPMSEKELITIASKWKPHRTMASLYLWKMIDINGGEW